MTYLFYNWKFISFAPFTHLPTPPPFAATTSLFSVSTSLGLSESVFFFFFFILTDELVEEIMVLLSNGFPRAH